MTNPQITISDCYNGLTGLLFTPFYQDALLALHHEINLPRLGIIGKELMEPVDQNSKDYKKLYKRLIKRNVDHNNDLVIDVLSTKVDGEIETPADYKWTNIVKNYQSIINLSTKPHLQSAPIVKLRGINSIERNFCINGTPISATLIDLFTLCFHTVEILNKTKNAKFELSFTIPDVETRAEVRWWNLLLARVEAILGLPMGIIMISFTSDSLPVYSFQEALFKDIPDSSVQFACGA